MSARTGSMLVLLCACVAACDRTHAVPAAAVPQRVTSLTRLAGTLAANGGENGAIELWQRGWDKQIALVQRSAEPLRLGPIPAGDACVLRFALGFELPANASAKPAKVDLRATLASEGDPESRVVFEESLDATAQAGTWARREVLLGGAPGAARTLVLEARTSGGPRIPVAWGSPHVVCDDARPRPAAPARPHVILISIDTLRADHLGAYGYPRATSPHLDALAEQALVFENAFATAPWTLPSHASMLTGRYPEEHRAGHGSISAPLSPDVVTLAETLADEGYRTVAHTGAGYVGEVHGIARGFADWTERPFASLASALPEVLHDLSRASGPGDVDRLPDAPVFLFLHTYNVHAPYWHPPEAERFRDAPPVPAPPGFAEPSEAERASWWAAARRLKLHDHLLLDRFRSLSDLIAAYDASIAFVDAELGRLFEFLERAGMLDGALVIVTSDHGESFLERGPYISHAYTFYDEEVHVPLIVRLPHAERRGRDARLVDLTDLAPLILEVAGVPPRGPLSGRSPLHPIDAERPAREQVRGESAYTGGLYARTREWKLMTKVSDLGALGLARPSEIVPSFVHDEQVYDLKNDPAERANRAGDAASLPEPIWILRQQLGSIEPPGTEDERERALPPEQLEQLRALGYVGAEPAEKSDEDE